MKPCYHCTCLVLACLLSSGRVPAAGATEVHQWLDADGQVHYGDRAPPGIAATRTLRLHDTATATTGGLRPAERLAIKRIEQRTQERHLADESAQRTRQQQQANRQKQCREVRDKFKTARKNEDFNQHALYLRRHCW